MQSWTYRDPSQPSDDVGYRQWYARRLTSLTNWQPIVQGPQIPFEENYVNQCRLNTDVYYPSELDKWGEPDAKSYPEYQESYSGMCRSDIKVWLDKAHREWKVEWRDNGNHKMKRFSCKRWGKAKAYASALEYYWLIKAGAPLSPSRPFFSQARRYMDRSRNFNAAKEAQWPSEASVENDSRQPEPKARDVDPVEAAWISGAMSMDSLEASMNASYGFPRQNKGFGYYQDNEQYSAYDHSDPYGYTC